MRLADAPRRFPFVRTRRAGDFVFTAGIADPTPLTDRPPHVRAASAETAAVYSELELELGAARSSLSELVSLLQFFKTREVAAPYIEQRRKALGSPQPASTGIAVSSVVESACSIQVEAVAVVSEHANALTHISTTQSPQNIRAGYSQAVRFRDWVFCAGVMASDYRSAAPYPGALGTGLAEAARSDSNYWNASPIYTELRYILFDKLSPVLQAAGSSLESLAVANIFLNDAPNDYAAFCEAWLNLWNDHPPLTVITPCTGLGTWGGRVEVTPVALTSDSTTPIIDLPRASSYAPFPVVARRVGDFVFTGTLVAADEKGRPNAQPPDRSSRELWDPVDLEMRSILSQLQAIAQACGGGLKDVVRIRLCVDDRRRIPAVLHSWREMLPDDFVSSIFTVDSGQWVPGCAASVDAILHIPQNDVNGAAGAIRT